MRAAGDPAARVLVLAGAGERAFCTGNDVSEFDAIRADPAAAAQYTVPVRHAAAIRAELPSDAYCRVSTLRRGGR